MRTSVSSLSISSRSYGVSDAAVKTWSKAFSWQRRFEEREASVAHAVEQKTVRAEVDRRSRNQRITEAGIVAVARAIADGRIKPTLADLDRLVRLESFVEGRPDSRTEVIDAELRR
jgi:hypothetical protein